MRVNRRELMREPALMWDFVTQVLLRCLELGTVLRFELVQDDLRVDQLRDCVVSLAVQICLVREPALHAPSPADERTEESIDFVGTALEELGKISADLLSLAKTSSD